VMFTNDLGETQTCDVKLIIIIVIIIIIIIISYESEILLLDHLQYDTVAVAANTSSFIGSFNCSTGT